MSPESRRPAVIATESPIEAARSIQIDVTALQVPEALGRVIGRTAVQDAAVVEHHQLAGGEREPQFERGIGEQLPQAGAAARAGSGAWSPRPSPASVHGTDCPCARRGRPARFHYNNYPLLLNAAIEGNGIALGWHGLIGPLLEEGTLVGLSPVVERTGQGYLLGTPHEDSAVIASLVDWFVRECGEVA